MGKKAEKPPKIANVKERISEHLANGTIIFSTHALQRFAERILTQMEVKDVLRSGKHMRVKDEFNETARRWGYRIEGRTQGDQRPLAVVVSFLDSRMLVVTAIDLSSSNHGRG